MIIDCISDLHGYYPKLEGGHLLIVAGDLTARDTLEEHLEFIKWCVGEPYSKVVYISGNHDNTCLVEPASNKKVEYLCDSGTEFEGLKIWGSPWTKTFPGMNPLCKAFTVDAEEELAEKWGLIPDDVDILVTHSPPYGMFDKTQRGELVGSKSLLIRISEIKPVIHCFGHVHECGGEEVWIDWKKGTRFVNASHVNECYEPVNKPIRIEL